VLVVATPNRMPGFADLIVSATDAAAAAVVAVGIDLRFAAVPRVMVAVRPTGVARRDLALPTLAGRTAVVERAVVAARTAVAVVALQVRASPAT